jgi:hypothetical protein
MCAAPRLFQVDSLTIDEDLEFQRRSWRAQRIGQSLVALFVLGGLLGVFGRGWLAEREASAPGITVNYPGFLRLQAPAEITVRLALDPSARERAVELWLDDAIAERFEFTEIMPEPESRRLQDGRPVHRFTVRGDSAATIRLRVNPRHCGWSRARLGLVGGPEVELRQLIYP